MKKKKVIPENYIKSYGYIIFPVIIFVISFGLIHFDKIQINNTFFNEATNYALVMLGFVMSTMSIFIALITTNETELMKSIKKAGYVAIFFNASCICIAFSIFLIMCNILWSHNNIIQFPLFCGSVASACNIIYYMIRIGKSTTK